MPIVLDPPFAPPLEAPADEPSALWEVLYEALGFHRESDPDGGYALQKVCEAWCVPLQRGHDLVRERTDGTAGWGVLFDVDRCPAESLPYLAQYVGVILTPEMSEEQRRNEIREPTGWTRGRAASIEVAGQRTLTGTRRVVIRSRTPGAGAHYIRTLTSETPDEARTRAVLRAALPAWETLDYEAFDGLTYADLNAGYASYTVVASVFPTYGDVIDGTLP